jgi:hypothetical protein
LPSPLAVHAVCVCVVCMRVFPPRLLDAPSPLTIAWVIHMGRNRLLIVDLAPQLLSDPFGHCPFPLWLRPISALPFSLRHRSADRPFFYYDFAYRYYISNAPLFQMWLDVDVCTSFYYYYIVDCWGGFVHY